MLALTQQNILEEEKLKHGVGKRRWFKHLILNIKLHHLTGSYTNKTSILLQNTQLCLTLMILKHKVLFLGVCF